MELEAYSGGAEGIYAEPTPVIFDEFKRCNSEYVISDKDSESAISSDGEFIDAGKINVYDEGDSQIDRIEERLARQFLRDDIYHGIAPPSKPLTTNGYPSLTKFTSLKTLQNGLAGSQSLKRTI